MCVLSVCILDTSSHDPLIGWISHHTPVEARVLDHHCSWQAAHQSHFESAKKQEKDPEGGPFPAYPSGKTWDEPSGLTGAGKKFFHNIIDGSKVKTEPFYSALWLKNPPGNGDMF